MLVLTRRAGEKLLIGDNIVVTVLGIQHGQVKFGIDAPADVKILRNELNDRTAKAQGVELPITGT